QIIYLSMDSIKLRDSSIFLNIITYLQELLSQQNRFKDKIYFFIDEIHNLKNWAYELKAIFDLKLNIKFVITGSSSLSITKHSGESLFGRCEYFNIYPFSYLEITRHKLNNNLVVDFKENNFSKLTKLFQENNIKLRQILKSYIIEGGYPAIYIENKPTKQKYELLQSYINDALTRDLFSIEEIRDTKSISKIFEILSLQVGSKTNYSNIGKLLGIKGDTVRRYVYLICDIHLLNIVNTYSDNPNYKYRKQEKIYFLDNGLRNSSTFKLDFNDSEYGFLAENLVNIYAQINDFKLFYSLDNKDKEVDFVFKKNDLKFAIEVKYQTKIEEKDYEPLVELLKQDKSLSYGIIVTKNILDKKEIDNKKIYFIPLELFLLCKF
ncbi:MAG: ATP-binding protein, partial [archaeon]